MPCYDDRTEIETSKMEAILCAIVTHFGVDSLLDQIDFTKCGVRKEWLREWWDRHQLRDKYLTKKRKQ